LNGRKAVDLKPEKDSNFPSVNAKQSRWYILELPLTEITRTESCKAVRILFL